MTKTRMLICMLLLCALAAPALAEAPAALDTIMASRALKVYTDGPVDDETIKTILAAGLQAPSAMNRQPWHFTVVPGGDFYAGNGVMIVISGAQDSDWATFDCGLAVQSMYLAAQALGLGANIVASPVATLETNRNALDIPEGYAVIMAMTLGHPAADAETSASPRYALEEMVTWTE